MFEVCLERLEPGTVVVAIGKPLSVLAAIRMTNDHDKLGRVVVVSCFEFQGFVVAFKKATAWVTPRSKAPPQLIPAPSFWGQQSCWKEEKFRPEGQSVESSRDECGWWAG